MYYYVYYSYEPWGRGYIGRRGCKCLPTKDIYFGTFTDKTFAPTEKIILSVYNTLEETSEAEVYLHEFYQVHKNPHFANKAKQTSKKFYNNLTDEQRNRQSDLVTSVNNRKENPFKKKGEESMSHGRKWVTTPAKTEEKYLKSGEEIPEGWILGRMKRPPRSKESRKKTSQSLKGKTKSESHKNNLRKATLKYYAERGKTI